MLTSILFKIFLSIIFGAAIGLERESALPKNESSLGGIRTYALFCLLGALAGIFYLNDVLLISLVIMGAVLALVLVYYILGSYATKNLGLTSELAVVVTFIIGFLLVLDVVPLQIIIAVFVLFVLILAMKSKTTKFVAGITHNEIQAFVSYAIMALVVFPFLPNTGYALLDLPLLPDLFRNLNINLGQFADLELINPRTIWLIVVLITGIDVFGYILSRFVGQKKGFVIASFFAGFVSSTAVTQSMAQKSKKNSLVEYLVGVALVANTASFIQLFILIAPFNVRWLFFVVPSVIIMIASAGVLSFYFLRKKTVTVEEEQKEIQEKSGAIFSLMPALKFAGLLIVVKIVTKICLILFGKSGFMVSALVASLVGLDAVVVTLAEMAGSVITYKFALIVLLLVSGTNLVGKTFYSFILGSRRFAVKFLISAVVITVLSFVWVLFI